MLKAPSEFIIVFIMISVLLLLGMVVFISVVIYRYQQKQNAYFKDIEALKASHENALLQAQVEVQEQTIQNMSQEIHDNIGQKLTLAKLYLNTIEFANTQKSSLQVHDAVDIIGAAIDNLTSLSRSMSSEAILKNGLREALQFETDRLRKTGLYSICFSATDEPAFLDKHTELLVFRMVQEALNNIIKHAGASVIDINLYCSSNLLTVEISDDGNGFNMDEKIAGSGLQNIHKRARMLQGHVTISSDINAGTEIKIEIPLYEIDKTN